MSQIPQKLIELTREFLGEDGIKQFKDWYKKYHTVSPVYRKDNIIYSVHLLEGMAVRNFMRRTGYCREFTDQDYDNNWPILVMAACEIKEEDMEIKHRNGKYVYYKDKAGEWRFKLVAPNGEILVSSEGYSSKNACLKGIDSVKRLANLAEIKQQ